MDASVRMLSDVRVLQCGQRGLSNASVEWELTNVEWELANVEWELANVEWELTNVEWEC